MDVFLLFEHFSTGDHCSNGTTDTIACVTQTDPELKFGCLSPHSICDAKKDCINNEDENSCG
jgi:hypothetical protein